MGRIQTSGRIEATTQISAKGRVKNAAKWRSAVQALGSQIEQWRPQRFDVSRRPYSEDPHVEVLELAEGDQKIVLEPAFWARDEIPAQVDFWSSLGTRVRFVGPDQDGTWRVISTDLVNIHMSWDRPSFERLCDDLLYR